MRRARRVGAIASRRARIAGNDGGLEIEGYDQEAADERHKQRIDAFNAICVPSTDRDEIARRERLEAARLEVERIERAAEAFSKRSGAFARCLGG